MKYSPTHPAADVYGYVKFPNVIQAIEKADSLEAQRSYEANINIIDVTKNMVQKTIDILK